MGKNKKVTYVTGNVLGIPTGVVHIITDDSAEEKISSGNKHLKQVPNTAKEHSTLPENSKRKTCGHSNKEVRIKHRKPIIK